MGQIEGFKVVITANSAASLAGLAGAAVRRVTREGALVTLVAPMLLRARLWLRMPASRWASRQCQSSFGHAVAGRKAMGGLDALVNVVQPDSPWQSFADKVRTFQVCLRWADCDGRRVARGRTSRAVAKEPA
jgi:hypothetical protein